MTCFGTLCCACCAVCCSGLPAQRAQDDDEGDDDSNDGDTRRRSLLAAPQNGTSADADATHQQPKRQRRQTVPGFGQRGQRQQKDAEPAAKPAANATKPAAAANATKPAAAVNATKPAAAVNATKAAPTQGAKNATAAAPVAEAMQTGRRMLGRMLMGESLQVVAAT